MSLFVDETGDRKYIKWDWAKIVYRESRYTLLQTVWSNSFFAHLPVGSFTFWKLSSVQYWVFRKCFSRTFWFSSANYFISSNIVQFLLALKIKLNIPVFFFKIDTFPNYLLISSSEAHLKKYNYYSNVYYCFYFQYNCVTSWKRVV